MSSIEGVPGRERTGVPEAELSDPRRSIRSLPGRAFERSRASVERATRAATASQSRTGWIVFGSVTLVAAIVRVISERQFTAQVDEPASLLAIDLVAHKGAPMFPSGVLYLQGATLSYLAAPLAWFFHGIELLDAVRLLNLLISVLIVPVCMKLTLTVTRSLTAAAVTGVLIACDPNLIVWGFTVRPYALLALETALLAHLAMALMRDGASARIWRARVVYLLPLLVLLGTFTHIGFWLGMPGVALLLTMKWRRALFREQRAILVGGLVSCLAPIVFLVMGETIGIGSGTTSGTLNESFTGSHLFSLDRLKHPQQIGWGLWTSNFFHGPFHFVMPSLIALMSGILAYRSLALPRTDEEGDESSAIAVILLMHWSAIAAVAMLVTSDPEPRYLNQILPLGYVILGVGESLLWREAGRLQQLNRVVVRAFVVGAFIVPAFANGVSSARWQMHDPGADGDYLAATEWTASQWSEGDVALTALPASAYFWFDDETISNDLYFIAGPAGSQRSERYIKLLKDGSSGDFWLGAASIGSSADLCRVLSAHAGAAWIIVDTMRLEATWALQGQMATVITGSSTIVDREANGTFVLKVRPVAAWSRPAAFICNSLRGQ